MVTLGTHVRPMPPPALPFVAGWDVMQAHELPGFRPVPARSSGAEEDPQTEARAVAALREFRGAEAARRAVPPHIVFNDSTMRALAVERPRTEEQFLAVSGLGPRRWQQFGERVLVLLQLAEA